MNPCALTDQLDAYLDGDLAPAETRAFEAHAGACPACTAELALARRLQGALRALPAEPCPYEVFQGALDRIARESKDRPALPSPALARRLQGALHALPDESCPYDVFQGALDRIAREEKAAPRSDRPARPSRAAAAGVRLPRWQVAAAGFALVVLLALALALLRPAAESVPADPIATTEQPADPLPTAEPPPEDEPAAPVAEDSTAAPVPAPGPVDARPAPQPAPQPAPRRPRAAPPDATPAAAPRSDLAEAAPGTATEAAPQPTDAEIASAREGVHLAFSLFADANRQATQAVRANVGQGLEHVSGALNFLR